MMKVSKGSWHYRLYRYTSNIPKGPRYIIPRTKRDDVAPPPSLCPYAWSIFLSLVGTAVLLAVAAPLAAVFAPLYVLYRALEWADGKAGLDRIRELRAQRRREKPRREPDPPAERHPSLLAAFVRAKKDKVCPTIELVD